VGITASYFDVKKGIIPNNLILRGFTLGFLFYLSFFFYDLYFLETKEIINYLPPTLLNGVIGIIIGYLLWNFNFWSAGDGKLFGLYSFLLPLEFYSEAYINYFPAFSLLVNLFIPLIIFLVIKMLIYGIKKKEYLFKKVKKTHFWEKDKLIKFLFKFIALFSNFLFFIITIRGVYFLFGYFEIRINPFFVFIPLILLFKFLREKTKNNKKSQVVRYIVILIFLGYLLIERDYQIIIYYSRMAILFMSIFFLLKKSLNFYIKEEEIKEIRAKNVKKGMILTKEWKNYFSKKITKLDKKGKDKHFKKMSAEGLTNRQAQIIRELFNDDPNYTIEICNSFPFAPFLLMSALISIMTSSSFIPVLRILLISLY
jgi:Flp pilus assembly protein protease CpaA